MSTGAPAQQPVALPSVSRTIKLRRRAPMTSLERKRRSHNDAEHSGSFEDCRCMRSYSVDWERDYDVEESDLVGVNLSIDGISHKRPQRQMRFDTKQTTQLKPIKLSVRSSEHTPQQKRISHHKVVRPRTTQSVQRRNHAARMHIRQQAAKQRAPRLEIFVIRAIVNYHKREFEKAQRDNNATHIQVAAPRNKLLALPALRIPQLQLSNIKNTLITVGLCAVIVLGGFVTWRSFVLNQAIEAASPEFNVSVGPVVSAEEDPIADDGDVDSLDEVTRPDIASHRVAADMPRIVRIPALGKEGRVLEVGVTENNKMQVPRSIYDAGWFNGSVKPGRGAGAVVLDAHASGRTQPGLFRGINTLQKGAVIEIERGDGKVITYEVVEKEQVPYEDVDMLKALTPIVPGKESLTLITCGGEFDTDDWRFLSREIVYAVRTN